MTELFRLDPLLWGYFQDESLEEGERVGLALIAAAKYGEFGFSAQLLPEPCWNRPDKASGYSPYEGLWFRPEALEALLEEYPEHEKALRSCISRIRIRQQKMQRLRAHRIGLDNISKFNHIISYSKLCV